MNYPDSGL